jgi:hypothetical protein
MSRLPGVFCLEGEWSEDLRDRWNVEPILQLLERLEYLTAIHRDVASKAELTYYLSKWVQQRYADYGVLYLACDGAAGELALGRDAITFAELAEVLDGRCTGRTLYFSACLTLDISDDMLAHSVRWPDRRQGRRRIRKADRLARVCGVRVLAAGATRPREPDRRVLQRLAARPR